jgi:proteasome lid subunit RPN8/RPN11
MRADGARSVVADRLGMMTHGTWRVAESVLETILARARAAVPEECCGVLIGGDAVVVEAIAAHNISSQPTTRFLLDPKTHFDALRRARSRGLDVVGFYHSHPRSDAAPSATDLAEATYPDHLFLIAGLGRDPAEVRLYRFAAGNFQPTPFVTVP